MQGILVVQSGLVAVSRVRLTQAITEVDDGGTQEGTSVHISW